MKKSRTYEFRQHGFGLFDRYGHGDIGRRTETKKIVANRLGIDFLTTVSSLISIRAERFSSIRSSERLSVGTEI